jgi:hypothetical protein
LSKAHKGTLFNIDLFSPKIVPISQFLTISYNPNTAFFMSEHFYEHYRRNFDALHESNNKIQNIFFRPNPTLSKRSIGGVGGTKIKIKISRNPDDIVFSLIFFYCQETLDTKTKIIEGLGLLQLFSVFF